MKDNSLSPIPDKDRTDLVPGFLRLDAVWLAQPVQTFPLFDIKQPVFYMVNGTPMAFAGEVLP